MDHTQNENVGSQGPDGFIGIDEAAKFLGVSQATIRRMTSANKLKCYRFSRMGHRRFRRKDLVEAFSVQAG